MPTKSQVRAGNLWNSYVRGWSHGAAAKAMDPVFTSHTNHEIVEAYSSGYKAGRDARNLVAQDAAQHYGYTPDVLRLAGHERPRCGVEGCRLDPDHAGKHAFGPNIP